MNILLITGGISSERSVSLISAKEVKKALEENKHKVKMFDIKHGTDEMVKLIKNCDLVFPVLHGEEGEGGDLQKLLQKSGKLYIGGDPEGLKVGWYKIPFKQFCDKNNVPSAPWKEVNTIDEVIKFGLPCVVKSTNGGSSKEVAILKTNADLKQKMFLDLFKLNQPLYAEKFLPGIEITVGILGNKALPVVEIVPPEGSWFDFKNKYSGETKEIVNTPNLTPKIKKQVQEIALKIHKDLNLGPYSRIDFIVSDLPSHISGGEAKPYVLEVNIIPGMTPNSLFPKAALGAGYTFPQLIQKLIKLAIQNTKNQ
ncbi:MAG: ATP-grasp domain-containing protein [Candidatus Daviesbacteria bacterium]|nr:ATP-grasp domain-containing protein [Candidatus Daviesbacteria bacterium]